MNLYTSPIFLQAACGHGEPAEPESKITLRFNAKNQSIDMSCEGDIKVAYIFGGEAQEDTYTDIESTTVYIPCDANTDVVITGKVTEIDLASQNNLTAATIENTALTKLNCEDCDVLASIDLSANTALTKLECGDCSALASINLSANTALTHLDFGINYALASIDLSANTALTHLNCTGCAVLASLDLSANTALTSLNCSYCYALASLNLSANTALTHLTCDGCYALASIDLSANTALTHLTCDECGKIESIYYPATNSDVATAIAGAITAAEADDGTVYTDSAADYYSTIETAANDKGWTIAALPA